MKNKLKAIKEIFQAIGMFFALLFLQVWYIITGNE
jgi:hypothetical protein